MAKNKKRRESTLKPSLLKILSCLSSLCLSRSLSSLFSRCFSSSFLSSLGSSLFGSLGSEFGTLGSNSLSLSLLNGNLSFSSSNSSFLGSFSQTRYLSGNLSLLGSLPSVELSLSLSLSQSTLLDTTTKVLHQENALVREDLLGCKSWLSASFYPIEGALEVNVDSSRIRVWIVSTDLLNILTITWRSAICDYD